ncbi:MFS transporter [Nocardia abscessus]|uniref:MFS transporter n=1 Tax=Nocardia abscessus TaxID=120957 RepID=UPI002456A992|nr:MFS transporter [Nocardia abscessus]
MTAQSEHASPTSLSDRPEATGASPRSLRRTVIGSIVGTVVEYYDFGIYGYMATVLAALFFHSGDPTAALLGTLAAFAVAFFLRIPGGILFGHIGDRYGRKRALSWTILLMCLATLGIGILPTYFTIGIWATVLLVLLRCLQGIAAGGELGGATAFVAESAPPHKRAGLTSLVNVGINLGSLAAALTALAVNSVFTPEQIEDVAWRIPFLISLPLAFIGIWIRSRMEDTPQFEELKEAGEVAKVPVAVLFRDCRPIIVRIACLSALFTGGHYVAYVYGPIHMQTVGGHTAQMSFASTCLALVCGAVMMNAAGHLSDRVGRRPVFLAAAVAGVVMPLPAFALMGGSATAAAVIGQVLLSIPVSLSIGPAFSAFAEMMSARVRYSGISLGMNIAQLILGGTAPFLCAWLVDLTQISLAPAGLFAVCAALVLLGSIRMRETTGAPLMVD